MIKVNKLVCFIVVFITVMTAFCTVSFGANIKQCDLSKWQNVNLNYTGSQPTPNWKLNDTNTTVTQTVNARPSVLISDINCINNKVDGSLCVDTDFDNDFIGFVFGYQDQGHYYLFDWKQDDEDWKEDGYANKGMSIKLVNSNSSFSNKDFWATSGTDKVKILYHNDITYNDFTDYNFTLNFTDSGTFNIIVKQGDKVLDNITINDSTYKSGKFGFYNYSQEMVTYTGFTFEELPPVLEVVSNEHSKVSLAWNVVEGATGYNIKRATKKGGTYTTIATTAENTYTDTDVVKDTTYYYVVNAVTNDTQGENSNEVSATPKASNILKLVLEVNEEKQLSISDELSDNTEMEWKSSAFDIATVDANGKIKALKPGSAIITCTSKDYTETINVLVVDLDYQLAVDLMTGEKCRLTIDDLTNTTDVKWTAYDPTIATVTAKGKVTAVGEGLTYIVAIDKTGNEIGRIYIRVR